MDNTDSTTAIENETQSHGTENVVNEREEETQEDDKDTIESEEETNEREDTIHESEEVAHEKENVSDENVAESEDEKRTPESEMPISDDLTEIESIMKKEPIEDITISPDIIIKEEYEDEEPSTNTVWVAEGLMEEDEAKYCIPSTSYMREEQLIRAVKDHPHLYDFSHQNYHNNSVRDNSWEIIGKQMGCCAEECKAKWNSLMEYFSKAVQFSSKKSSEVPKKIWHLEQEIEFLRPFLMVQNYQTSNFKPLSEDNKVEENINERLLSKLLLQDLQPLKTGNEIKQESFTPMFDSIFKECIGKKYKPQQDYLTKFFQSMEATVRTLPPLLQVRIKSQISELVHNGEYEAVASCRNAYKPVPGPSRPPLACSAVPNGPNLFSEQLRPVSSHTSTPVPNSRRAEYRTGLTKPPTVPLRRPSNKNQLFSHL